MWILTPSLTSRFAAATGASTSASNEQLASAFARSLLSRSKHSPQRTWLQRLKRDSWTTHLSGAISSDSLGESFTDWWTSSLAATRASRSAQPASDSAPKTQDTSGRLSQMELLQCDQVSVSLKTSRDISRWGCPTLSKTWQDWVTERRGAWRARVNAARLIRGSGSSSWPTISVNESKNSVGKSQLDRNSIPLGTMAAWTTPTPWQQEESLDSWETRKAKNKAKGYNGNGQGTPLDMQVKILGQAAPASSSSLGSRQGLLVDWRTPQAQEAGAKVETLFTKDGAPAMPGQRAYRKTPSGRLVLQSQTINQQVEMVENWATPRANERDGTRTPNGNPAKDGIPLGLQARVEETWATPAVTMTGGPTGLGGGSGNRAKMYRLMGEEVGRQMCCGKLNPRWVETLMGLPIGWTMPSCSRPLTIAPTSYDSSGMALCQPAQSERLDFLLAS